jgi:hypothetical protein
VLEHAAGSAGINIACFANHFPPCGSFHAPVFTAVQDDLFLKPIGQKAIGLMDLVDVKTPVSRQVLVLAQHSFKNEDLESRAEDDYGTVLAEVYFKTGRI